MITIHLTKTALESEKALYEHWLNDCEDYEHCEQYQEEIDALTECLRSGIGHAFTITYVMDSLNFINEPNARPIKIDEDDIGLNLLKSE